MTIYFLSRTSALFLIFSPVVLFAQEKREVKTVRPQPATAGRAYDLPGRTEPLESATLFSRATGIIRERKFDIGDVVKEGETLAIVDAPDLDRSVQASEASITQAKARAMSARSLANRSRSLLESQAVSQEEADQREASALELEAAVLVAEADHARLVELQKFSTIRAPFDAIITSRNFDRGDRVRGDASTSENWLYQISRTDQLRFVVNATPDLALRLTSENPATIRFNELPGKNFEARVSRASRVFDKNSGTMRLELLMDNKDLTLPVGLTGTASFPLKVAQETYLVPTNTLTIREGKPVLLTVNGGTVELQEVIPGRNFGPSVEVTSSALNPNTAIIINPNALIRPGDAVTASTTK
ncbi:MAG: efflux RND transporter periplasmic adaptor subunit [Luteolibacter sp.]